MKIPFLNRKRYIVLKAYTWNKFFLDNAPIQISSKDPNPQKTKNQEIDGNDFRLCYARTMGRNKCATIFAPCSMNFHMKVNDKQQVEPSYEMSMLSSWIDVTFDHTADPYYNTNQVCIGKISMPWMLHEETGVNFLLARHIENSSPMMIPSGILSYKLQHQLHIFNHLMRMPLSYEVTFREPIASLFPLTDKPLHVESYYDITKYQELDAISASRPYFKNHRMKLEKKLKEIR